jgi:hypothetical protein
MRDFLVIIPAGRDSYHMKCKWFSEKRLYDLWVVCYDEAALEDCKKTSDLCEFKQGPKWQLIRFMINKYKDEVKKYSAVWFPDDDLQISVAHINLMMDRFKDDYYIQIAQPSMYNYNVSWPGTIHQENGEDVLFTNIAEVMAPLLRTDVLFDIFPVIDRDECKCAWGVDISWNHLYQVAIMNQSIMRHTKPVCGGSETFYKKYNIDPIKEAGDNKKFINDNLEMFKLRRRFTPVP